MLTQRGGVLTNNSKNTIYYKPDDPSDFQSDWGAYALEPGATTSTLVDAIYVDGKVYKIDGGYNYVTVTKTNKIQFEYPWYYFGTTGVNRKDRNWLREQMYYPSGKERRYEWPPGSKNYDTHDTQWWNIFNPFNQISDPRRR